MGSLWAKGSEANWSYLVEARERELTLKKCQILLTRITTTASVSSSPRTSEQSSPTTAASAPVISSEYSDFCGNYPAFVVWDSHLRRQTSCESYLAFRKERRPTTIIAAAFERVDLPASLRKKHRDAIAVIIGNKTYRGRVPEVSFAHNAAAAMRRFVLERLGYRAGNVIDLRDATQAEMLAVFGNARNYEGKLFNWVRAGKSDVVVFYSGHGVPGMRDKRPYLLAVDSDPNQAEFTGIAVDVLFANLARIPARSMTVYLDACFSGESPKGMIIRATSGLSITPKLPTAASAMTIITAAQADQFASWDEEARHGLFTKHLLEALSGKADAKEFGNSDGKVTLAEVQNYLDDEMTYQARRTWGRRQQAYVRGDAGAVLSLIPK
jgi:hypothetical protein